MKNQFHILLFVPLACYRTNSWRLHKKRPPY